MDKSTTKEAGEGALMAHIWVVEGKFKDGWGPTLGVGYTRALARLRKEDYSKLNPDERFRVRKYERTYSKVVVYEHDGGR